MSSKQYRYNIERTIKCNREEHFLLEKKKQIFDEGALYCALDVHQSNVSLLCDKYWSDLLRMANKCIRMIIADVLNVKWNEITEAQMMTALKSQRNAFYNG